MPRFALIVMLLLVGAGAAPAGAQVRASLPHEGYYRVGRYMPVRVVADGPSGAAGGNVDVTVSAAGAVPAILPGGIPPGGTIAPLLVLRPGARSTTVRVGNAGPQQIDAALRPLGDDDRLVGTLVDPPALTWPAVFRGLNVIRVALEPGAMRSPPGSEVPIEWTALDAVVLDRPAVARLSDDAIGKLLGRGTVIVTPDEPGPPAQPSATRWPWQRAGDVWVLRHEPAGPRGAVAPDVYLPVSDWEPGWPPAVRQQAVVRGVLFAIFALAVLLWRGRRSVLPMLALVAVYVCLLYVWRERQPAVRHAEGTVIVRGGSLQQVDQWTYQGAVTAGDQDAYIGDGHHPVFASFAQAERFNARIFVYDGQPRRMQMTMPRGAALATVRSYVMPDAGLDAAVPMSGAGPLAALARATYLTPGSQIAAPDGSTYSEGSSDWRSQSWPTVTVLRNLPTTRP